MKVRAEMLVPGDVVILAQGDKIPADCRIISTESNSFRIDQAILTGESESVEKYPTIIPDPKAVKQDQINMLFFVSRPVMSLIIGYNSHNWSCQSNRDRNRNFNSNRRHPRKHRFPDL